MDNGRTVSRRDESSGSRGARRWSDGHSAVCQISSSDVGTGVT